MCQRVPFAGHDVINEFYDKLVTYGLLSNSIEYLDDADTFDVVSLCRIISLLITMFVSAGYHSALNAW